jgi:hypothetical protein
MVYLCSDDNRRCLLTHIYFSLPPICVSSFQNNNYLNIPKNIECKNIVIDISSYHTHQVVLHDEQCISEYINTYINDAIAV